jgi:hypothetical protein
MFQRPPIVSEWKCKCLNRIFRHNFAAFQENVEGKYRVSRPTHIDVRIRGAPVAAGAIDLPRRRRARRTVIAALARAGDLGQPGRVAIVAIVALRVGAHQRGRAVSADRARGIDARARRAIGRLGARVLRGRRRAGRAPVAAAANVGRRRQARRAAVRAGRARDGRGGPVGRAVGGRRTRGRRPRADRAVGGRIAAIGGGRRRAGRTIVAAAARARDGRQARRIAKVALRAVRVDGHARRRTKGADRAVDEARARLR